MAVSGAYLPINFDDFTPRPHGLLSVATAVTPTSDHWMAGVFWEPLCVSGSTTFTPCVTGGTAIQPATKVATHDDVNQGARPFTIITELDCAPVGTWADAEPNALRTLTRAEQRQVERAFWTGDAGGQHLVYPNLTTLGPILDGDILLQPAGTYVSGAPLDVVEGMCQLENALAACWDGVGVIHVPTILLPALCAQSLVYEEGGRLYTKSGNVVVAGAGYPWNVGPNGAVSPAGTGWLMATGPVFIIRGTPRVLDKRASLDRSVNTLKIISERTVLLGYSCCHVGVLVTLGGEPAGTPSA